MSFAYDNWRFHRNFFFNVKNYLTYLFLFSKRLYTLNKLALSTAIMIIVISDFILNLNASLKFLLLFSFVFLIEFH